jgi:hypothetical protein
MSTRAPSRAGSSSLASARSPPRRSRPAADPSAHDKRLADPLVAVAVARPISTLRSLLLISWLGPAQVWIASRVIRRAWMRQVTRVSLACCATG